MKYLAKLVCPPNGKIYDPFTGSGSTGKAAVLEGFDFIGSELDAEYCAIAEARIKYAVKHPEKVGVPNGRSQSVKSDIDEKQMKLF